ncbi:MAG: flippase-like domain-containing protein [Clostridia bacterium]|nr:flippase-like domain-containing protein [Clostridia bacterium]
MSKRLSKQTRSILFNLLIVAVTLGAVLFISAQGGDINDAWEALRSADPFWVLMAMVSWGVFMFFEGSVLHVFFRQQKVKISLGLSLLVGMIGSFYSAVTPAATGGQPMQVMALRKRGYSAGLSSSGLAVKFFTFQTALLSLGALLWIFHAKPLENCPQEAVWVTAVGFFINGLSVAAVILLAINKNIVRGVIGFFINAGHALHLIKDKEKMTARAEKAIEDFHGSVDMLRHHPIRLLHLYLLSCLQVLGLLSISYCVYRALGMNEYSYLDILTLQFLLFIAASFTPLPGSSGAQEGGFYVFFQHVFPADKLVGALLLWRFFTYYFTIIVCFGAVLYDSVWSIRHASVQTGEEEEDDARETLDLKKG